MRNTTTGPGEAAAEQESAERLVLELCRDVLHRREATLEDGFTELGGSSLTASQLLHLIQERTGIRIPAPALFRAQNLREVARLLTDRDV
ncbi:acyl carrier protein, partial [Nonomuraea sp. RK-328]|nr:acyl carrier protein [Nonomuraea sp. RK-328]